MQFKYGVRIVSNPKWRLRDKGLLQSEISSIIAEGCHFL